MSSGSSPDPRELGFYFALAQIGFEMMVPVGLGLLVDFLLGWLPWLTIAGAGLGFAGGLTHMVLMLNRHERELEERRRSGPKE
jgi:F0F1-type ATP synthase assembly protein I